MMSGVIKRGSSFFGGVFLLIERVGTEGSLNEVHRGSWMNERDQRHPDRNTLLDTDLEIRSLGKFMCGQL